MGSGGGGGGLGEGGRVETSNSIYLILPFYLSPINFLFKFACILPGFF